MESIDYSEWTDEGLKTQYKETIKERDRTEEFSDRRDLNKQAMLIMTEILKRRK
jgi:hypothetical protein